MEFAILKLFCLFICLTIPYIICGDTVCDKQHKTLIESETKAKTFRKKHNFEEKNLPSAQLTWAGDNSGITIVAFTAPKTPKTTPSKLYLSDNSGAIFTEITKKLGPPIFINSENGLYRNPHDHENLYVICYNSDNSDTSFVYISEDHGGKWFKYPLPFVLNPNSGIYHNPDSKANGQFLILDVKSNLHLTKNRMKSWQNIIAKNVMKFDWNPVNSNQIFILHKIDNVKHISVYNVSTGSSRIIFKNGIYSYVSKSKFLFVSKIDPQDSDKRRLVVSTDSGLTFNETLLPNVTSSQFYAILDVEEDMAFIHVDEPGDNGSGTIYTSSSNGVIFSESFTHHFFPEKLQTSDFYKVLSLRGTYITTRLDSKSGTLSSYITHNRGATWTRISKPSNAECASSVAPEDCSLHLSLAFSQSQNVNGTLPLSISNAAGLILANGHTSDVSKISSPDVYISSDGGYTWIKSLIGPHKYEIADHGGLLIAVPRNNDTAHTVKFSTDEGRCWHTYNFTDQHNMRFAHLLTERGNKGLNVSIWGYTVNNGVTYWNVTVLDFGQIITRECKSADYETWISHSSLTTPDGKKADGCLMGKKEEFLRLKKDSLCKNGYAHEQNKSEEICTCTKMDYECEFGYSRKANAIECTKDANMKHLNVCLTESLKIVKTNGYRKVPGDVCKGGFTPDPTHQKILHQKCDGKYMDGDDQAYENKMTLLVVGLCLLVIMLILGVVLATKYHHLRSKMTPIRYTDLVSRANGEDTALLMDTDTPELPIDSDDELNDNRSPFGYQPAAVNYLHPVPGGANGNAGGGHGRHLPGAPTSHSSHTPGLEFNDESDVEMIT